MSIPIANVYYLLCYATDHVQEAELVDLASLEFKELPDLFAAVLDRATARLIQRGLDRSYVELSEEVSGIRGKLELASTVKRLTMLRGSTYCSFDELSRDIIQNQILKATLRNLCRLPSLRRDLRRNLTAHCHALGMVSDINLTDRHFSEVRLRRANRFYGFVLQLCWLVHRNLLLSEVSGELRFVDFRRDEAVMWSLFERFVRNFYRLEQTKYRIARRAIDWVQVTGSKSALDHLPGMEADTVLVASDECLVIDTKFYPEPLSSRYDSQTLRSRHLYQIITYTENRQLSDPQRRHRGILLYASIDYDFCFEFTVRGIPIEARTINLDQPWGGIHNEMLGVIDRDEPGFRAGLLGQVVPSGRGWQPDREALARHNERSRG